MSNPCRRPGPFRLPFPLDTPIALAALLGFALPSPAREAAIAEVFDYPAFFREAGRAVALAAIRDCGGEALEMSHAWREGEALANEASLVARAKGWLPEFLRAPEEAP